MDYQCLYTAGAANTVSHGVLWVAEGGVNTTPVSFVAYALYNQVAIVDTNSKTVVCTLLGDVATTKVRVNALTSCTVNINHSKANAHDVNSYCTIVAAAFEDGTVEVWYHLWGDTLRKWYRFDSTLEGLKGSTSAFTSYALPVQADVDDTAGIKSSVTRIPDIGGEGYFFVTAADSTGLVITWCCALHSQASDVSVNDKIVEDHKDASSSSPEILESSVYLVDMFKLPPAQMARSLHLQVLPSGDGSASTASASPAVGTVTGTSTGSGNDTTRSNGSSSTRSSSDHFAGGRVEVIGYIALFIGAVDARIRVYTAPILPLTHHRRTTGNHNSSSGTNNTTGTIDTSTGTGSGTVRSLLTPAGALQGHEEWVTCLSTRMVGNHTLLLASGSQDSKIRIWTLKVQHVQQQFSPPSLSSAATTAVEVAAVDLGKLSLDSANVGELVNEEEEDDDDDDNVNEGDIVPAKAADDDDATDATEARLQFRVQQQQGQQCRTLLFSVFLESLLIGHEDWVTSVHWMPFHEAADTTTAITTNTRNSIGYGTNGNKEGLEEKKDDAFAGYRLFSTSMDRNMVIWGVDASAGGIWVPMTRMGDMGGTLGGSIGGNLLGFVAGCVAPPLLNTTKLTANNKDNSNNSIHNCDDNNYDTTSTQSAISLLAVGYGGSFHLWSSSDGSDSSSSDGSRNHSGENDEDTQNADPKSSRWVPVPFLTGHFGAVNDLCWCTDQLLGDYIITASSDQTCRVFAPTRCDLKNNHAYRSVNDSNSDDRASGTEKWNAIMSSCNWREVSRPEIHGYDLNCVVHHPMPQRNQQQQQQKLQDLHTGSARVVYSAGEEKLIRVFEAPNSVLKGMLSLCQGKKRHDEQGDCEGGRDSGSGSAAIAAAAGGGGAASFGGDYDSLLPLSLGRIDQAYIPELGLSNKALEFMSEQEQQEHEARSVSHLTWEAPPLESQLADLTLWPETKKLFGHSNEVMCLAIGQHIDTRVTWMASASKARDASSARILLWKCEPTRMNNVPINGGTSSGSISEPAVAAPAAPAAPATTTVGEMQLVTKLEGHDSTVVCLSFSPDGRYLVSSGKDRTLCLYHHCSRAGTGAGGVSATYDTFEPVLVIKSAHKRIVWDCTWSPDGKFVFTVSRDGFCKVWQLLEETDKDSTNAGSVGAGMPSLVNVHTFAPMNGIRSGTIAVTAVAVRAAAGTNGGDGGAIGGYFVVVGTEGGDILLWRMNAVLVPTRVSSSAGSSDPKEAEEAALAEVATEIQIQMQLVLQVPQIHRHGCTVKRLRWQPSDSHQQTQQLLPVTLHWASVGEDNTVRVHKVTLNL